MSCWSPSTLQYPALSTRQRVLPQGESSIPDAHARARDPGQLDRARKSLVTLGVIVLEANLQLDRLVDVSLLLVVRVLEQFLDIGAHSGCESLAFEVDDDSAFGTYRL